MVSFPGGDDRPRIAISRCLLGDEVRYDGGHKREPWLVDTFGRFAEWVPVCPEVEIGMGTPREPIHLVASPDGLASGEHRVRLLGVHSARDWTGAIEAWRPVAIADLGRANLSGFILKADSPSCGIDGVAVTTEQGVTGSGRGLFAQGLLDAFPNLPIEDEGRLRDPAVRDNFVERVFAYQRLRRFFSSPWTVSELVAFHTAQKFLLLVRSRDAHERLGAIVAEAHALRPCQVASRYERAFMEVLRTMPTPGRHAVILHQMLGEFSSRIDEAARRELLAAIDAFRDGRLPLVTPIALMRHHVSRLEIEPLARQSYLEPRPYEASLRHQG